MKFSRRVLCVGFLIANVFGYDWENEASQELSVPTWIHRQKRNLIFPYKTSLQLTMGLSAALDLTGQTKGQINYAFQQNMMLPSNYTEILYPPTVKVKRDTHVYHRIMDLLEGYNLNGTECLRKTICQLAENPFEGGLIEEVINFVFTPSKHEERFSSDAEDPFLFAESVGRRKGDCYSEFPHCPNTPLDYISESEQTP